MKKIVAILLCVMMLLAGCSGKGTGETEAATEGAEASQTAETLSRGEYTASDYCTIEEYKGLKFKEKDVAASEADIQAKVDALLDDAKTLEEKEKDYKAKSGDVVNIDYTGYLGDEAFDGGSDTEFDLELGSNSFISGFEDGLIGAKKGDKLDLNLTFPDPYENNPDLAGKDVVFKVTVNAVKSYKLPEYTDDFVAENTSYKTIKEYEKALAEEIRQDNISTALAKKLFENAKFSEEYPESLKTYYEEQIIRSYDNYLKQYGSSLDAYLESIGTDKETFLNEQMGESIEGSMQSDLILGTVAEKEGIKAEGEDYEAYLAKQAEAYGMQTEELLETYGESVVQFLYVSDKAYDLIYDSIVIE